MWSVRNNGNQDHSKPWPSRRAVRPSVPSLFSSLWSGCNLMMVDGPKYPYNNMEWGGRSRRAGATALKSNLGRSENKNIIVWRCLILPQNTHNHLTKPILIAFFNSTINILKCRQAAEPPNTMGLTRCFFFLFVVFLFHSFYKIISFVEHVRRNWYLIDEIVFVMCAFGRPSAVWTMCLVGRYGHHMCVSICGCGDDY